MSSAAVLVESAQSQLPSGPVSPSIIQKSSLVSILGVNFPIVKRTVESVAKSVTSGPCIGGIKGTEILDYTVL